MLAGGPLFAGVSSSLVVEASDDGTGEDGSEGLLRMNGIPELSENVNLVGEGDRDPESGGVVFAELSVMGGLLLLKKNIGGDVDEDVERDVLFAS